MTEFPNLCPTSVWALLSTSETSDESLQRDSAQYALHDAASEAVPNNTCSSALKLFDNERHRIHKQHQDAFLNHKVGVGGMGGTEDVAMEFGRSCRHQQRLHQTTSRVGPAEPPHTT
eukprot:CAMPEP_0194488500 /NCGR_PEP_ID=MMETSP0253-20130528/8403_1 /TAXON_ID=2966 /ORGANISM="Noctiluca scintillans" /LENGTH=116 /DNA_ID=CAMNT_0039328875 /DNA_START=461 /DNA_END=813 /DNA_ORIENTATION=+